MVCRTMLRRAPAANQEEEEEDSSRRRLTGGLCEQSLVEPAADRRGVEGRLETLVKSSSSPTVAPAAAARAEPRATGFAQTSDNSVCASCAAAGWQMKNCSSIWDRTIVYCSERCSEPHETARTIFRCEAF